MNVLLAIAHYDDEVFGCGGTIHNLTKQGNRVYLITFFKTIYNNHYSQTKENLIKSCKILGISKKDIVNLQYTVHNYQIDTLQLYKRINDFVSKISPIDTIITHWDKDLNTDHIFVSNTMKVVFRSYLKKCKMFLQFPVISSYEVNGFQPNLIQVLDKEDLDAKVEAMKQYETEYKDYPYVRSVSSVMNEAYYWGKRVNEEYGEPFSILYKVGI
jgi:LmbE family N-acetylglucosaminyl deacetylase